MSTDRTIIVGASVAGIRSAQALRAAGYDGELLIVDQETASPYDKPPLTKAFLAGELEEDDITLLGPGGWSADELTPVLGQPAASVDVGRQLLTLADGSRLRFDELIVATGARARTIVDPASGAVMAPSVRTLDDALNLREALTGGGSVVVVGGGFIGAEVAATARALGLEVTIIEALATPFARALGSRVGSVIAELHAANDVNVIAGVGVDQVTRLSDSHSLVRLQDGRTLDASAVVAGIGVIPNTEWLGASGIAVDNGVLTDAFCRVVGADNVWAIGDVARWPDPATRTMRRVEHWTNAVDQANVVAANIVSPDQPKAYVPVPYFWSDQHGCKIQLVGNVPQSDDVVVEQYGTRTVALFGDADRLHAAVTFGWPRAMVVLRRLWSSGASLTEAREELEAITARGNVESAATKKGSLSI